MILKLKADLECLIKILILYIGMDVFIIIANHLRIEQIFYFFLEFTLIQVVY